MDLLLVIVATLLFIAFLATVGLALFYFGLFEDVKVNHGEAPIPLTGLTVAFKCRRGPYNQSGHLFTELTGDLARLIHGKETDSLRTIGFYYDDPNEVEESRQRYAVGVIFPSSDEEDWNEEKISCLSTGLLEKGYRMTTLPKTDHVVYTTFPFRSYLSIVIAVKRVYPVIRAYLSRHNLCAHPSLEIYTEDTIYFILPLSKQDSFYLFNSDDEEEEGSSCGDSGDEDAISSGSESESRKCKAGFSGRESNSEDEHGSSLDSNLRRRRNSVLNTVSTSSGPRKDSLSKNSSSSFEEITADNDKDK